MGNGRTMQAINEQHYANERERERERERGDAVFLTADNVEVTDYDEICTEASTLRLKPGEWPYKIQVAQATGPLAKAIGNGQPFILQSVTDEAANYLQANGCLDLVVFND